MHVSKADIDVAAGGQHIEFGYDSGESAVCHVSDALHGNPWRRTSTDVRKNGQAHRSHGRGVDGALDVDVTELPTVSAETACLERLSVAEISMSVCTLVSMMIECYPCR